MHRAEDGVFEKGDNVALSGFLQGCDGGTLEAKVTLEILGDFSDETLERELADEEGGRPLVATYLPESDSPRLVSVRLLNATGPV